MPNEGGGIGGLSAFSVISIGLTIISLIAGKKKSKKMKGAQNAIVGKRIFGDHVLACTYYSPRTVALWFNAVMVGSSYFIYAFNLPKAEFWGQEYDVGSARTNPNTNASTNVAYVENFTIEYSEYTGPEMFENPDLEFRRASRIPKFSRAGTDNPAYPSHTPGVSCFAVNQGFMGVNNGSVPSYQAIVSSIPGTVYMLRKYSETYGFSSDERYWVRRRWSYFLGEIVDLNPITILLDVILDMYRPEDIDWQSAVATGHKLLTAYPYMWFSMALSENRYADIISTMQKSARISVSLNEDSKISFKLLYDPYTVENPVDTIPMEKLVDIQVEKSSATTADIYNEVKASYLACRVAHPYTLEEFQALRGENGEYSEDTLNMLKSTELLYRQASAPAAINVANIYITGKRIRKSLTLDFLHWPDDVALFLQDTLNLFDRPLLKGSITTSMGYNNVGVGDQVRIEINLE